MSGIEQCQSCYADTVVVAVVSVPGLDAVDRSQEPYPPEPLDRTGFDKLPKKWVLEQRRCIHHPPEWRRVFHTCEQWQTMRAISVRRRPATRFVWAHFIRPWSHEP